MKGIQFTDKEGNPIGLCYSRCHNSPGQRCKCKCKGKYHGTGHTEAMRRHLEEVFGQFDLFTEKGKPNESKTRTVQIV